MSRIALIGDNSVEYVDKLLSIWNDGDCAVLIDWQVPIETSIRMMKEANVEKCYIDCRVHNRAYIPSCGILFCPYQVLTVSSCLLTAEVRTRFHANYSSDEAVVIYSSGTTGNARGIILSHFAISTNADAIIDYMHLTDTDCIYIARPLSHSSTLTGELLVALRSGCQCLLSPTIVPPRTIFNNISKYKVTILCINPTLLSMLCDNRNSSDISSLRVIYLSGSILSDEVYYKAKTVFNEVKIYNAYGLTEAGPRVSSQGYDCCIGNSVGKPIRDVEVVIVNENGTIVSGGERGIVHVNTPSRYSGYIVGKEKHPTLYKNWLNTGDIGYFDEYDELRIVGRIDDIIFLGAHKIYPNDIEAQILKTADVSECVVVSIRKNSEDILCCLYSSPNEIGEDIRSKLGVVLMKYEIPKAFVRTNSIPKTRTSKISLPQVKEIIAKELERRIKHESRRD